MRTAIFPAKYEALDAMREFVCQAAEDAGMNASDSYKVQLAVDEACSNIIEHACDGECGEDIEITSTALDDRLTVMIRDHGEPFDPDTVPMPDLDADLKDRPIGGLGIFLMKRLMDEIRYEILGGAGNVLTLVKYRTRER
jgi:anti-sigma regulatory factor (Ser/Thr protein kinase)